MVHAVKDFTVKTVQKAADLAIQAGGRLYTDSAGSYRALQGYMRTSSIIPRKNTHAARSMKIGRVLPVPYSSPICGYFVASVK